MSKDSSSVYRGRVLLRLDDPPEKKLLNWCQTELFSGRELFVDPSVLARFLNLTTDEVTRSLVRLESEGWIAGKKTFPFLGEGEYRLLNRKRRLTK